MCLASRNVSKMFSDSSREVFRPRIALNFFVLSQKTKKFSPEILKTIPLAHFWLSVA